MNELETIQKQIITCIDAWEAKASNNPFSWVDDMLSVSNHEVYYAVHMEWVDAWNKSDREKDMAFFLREWNTVENISRALKKWEVGLSISALGLLPIKCTYEQPFLIKPYDDSKPGYTGERRKYFPPEYRNAERLKKFDCLMIPRLKGMKDVKHIGVEGNGRARGIDIPISLKSCKVLGLYIAEGSVRSDRRTIQFVFNKSEIEYAELVDNWAKSLGLNPWQSTGKGTRVVYVSSKTLTDWFENEFGNGAYNKKIPEWAIYLPEPKQSELLKGYFLGDGTLHDNTRSALQATTKSKTLAMQGQIILIRNGFLAYINRVTDATGDSFRLNISGKSGQRLADAWGISIQKRKKRYNLGSMDSDYAYFPIRTIKSESFDEKANNLELEL